MIRFTRRSVLTATIAVVVTPFRRKTAKKSTKAGYGDLGDRNSASKKE